MKSIVITFYLLFMLSLAQAVPYEDADFACIREEQAEKFRRDFNINERSFGGRELCDASIDTKKLFNDLQIVKEGSFHEGDSDNVFDVGFVDKNDYYNWTISQTRGIRRGHDIPYATAYNQGGYFTMQDGWAALSTLGRVGTLIHEARHTEGYRHIRCTHGPYANAATSGCDRNLAYGGSHGVEMEYYARVVILGENFHPVYKTMARLMALGRSNFVFNDTPINAREALLLVPVAENANPFLLDGEERYEREAPAVAGAKLKRTSFGASYFYDSSYAMALDLYGRAHGAVSIDDDYSYYKMLDRDVDFTLLDLEELDVSIQRYLVAIDTDGRIRSYNFPRGKWFSPSRAISNAERLITTSPEGEEGVFVVSREGKIYPYSVQNRRVGAALAELWPEAMRSFVNWQGELLRLTKDGFLLKADGSAFVGERIQQMQRVPLYDAFEVTK